MNRIFLTTLASVALCYATTPQIFANPAKTDASQQSTPMSVEHSETKSESISENVVKSVEDQFNKIKDAGASLAADLKSEFDYQMDIAAAELKALRDANNKHHKKHHASIQRALHAAEGILKKFTNQQNHAKKLEDRKAKAAAKAEERKARAAERKAKAEARKAEREAAKAKREAEKAAKAVNAAHKQDKVKEKEENAMGKVYEKELIKEQTDDINHAEKTGQLDHGRSEGGSTEAPGTEAEKPETAEKK